MGDDITIGVTEIVNNIEVTAQPNDQIVDISVIDNTDEVTLNITPTVIEINVNKGSSYAKWGTILGTLSDQEDLQDALDLKADLVDGKVPSSQLPSYVDDVIEVANYAALPATGETGKIYVTIDNNKIFRWTGSTYVEIIDSAAVWGAITGTLSSQTDLQTALDTKALKTITITPNAPLSGGGDLSANRTISISQANTSTNGYLSSTDWNTFNSKQSALSGTGFVKISGTTISYDNSTYALDSAVVKLTGDQSITGSKSFTTNTAAPAMVVTNNSTDNGILLQNTSTGNALRINNGALSTGDLIRAGKDGNVTFIVNQNGNTTAASFIKSGGTSSQFLKADGSVDSTTYALDSAVVHLTGNETISGVKTLQNTLNLTAGVNIDDAYGFYWKTNVGEIETALAGIGQSSSGLNFFTGSSFVSPRMFINSSGSVGIGTSSPAYKLDVNGDISLSNGSYYKVGSVNLVNDTQYIPKATTLGYFVNSLLYDNGTNVGIGTTSPSYKLDVSTSSGENYIRVDSALNQDCGYRFSENGVNKWLMYNVAASDAFAIYDNTNSTERMRITSGGNVGIGNTGSAWGSGFLGLDLGGSTASNISGGVRTRILTNLFYNGTNHIYKSTSGGLGYFQDATNSTHTWFTSPSGTAGATATLTEAMRITSGGNVGIGTTTGISGKLTISSSGGDHIKLDRTGQTSRGIVISGSDNLSLGTWADPTQVSITSGGNVGIGTTSPLSRLHVDSLNTATDTVGNVFISASDALAANIGGQLTLGGLYNGSSKYAFGGIAARKENATSGNVAGYLALMSTTSAGALTERMRITSAGLVGIGTTTPANKLHIVGDAFANSRILLERTAGAIGKYSLGVQNVSGQFGIVDESSGTSVDRLVISPTGNVGVGTASPTSKLQVVGLPEYATNALAITGGLTVGAFYHTAGVLKVVI